jgi:hypothetical protein
VWNDDVNQVSLTINGTAVRTNSYGRGIVFNGTDTYLAIQDITDGVDTLTISMAANFGPISGVWNPVYHGGSYGGNDVFAYFPSDAVTDINVGTGNTLNLPTPTSISGLAWWDFVYSGTNVTVYKNGVGLLDDTIGIANIGFTSPLLIGARYDAGSINGGDLLNGTIYRIKGVLSALTPGQIITQYNSIASTYGLTPITITYTLTSDDNVDEGGGLTFTASGTNVPDGTYYWTIETNSGDFTVTSGSLGVSNNYGSFIVVPNADATTEGSETFTVALRSGSVSGPIVVTSAAITINDTSQTPSGTTLGPYNSAFEGGGPGTVYFLISTYPDITTVPIGAQMTGTIFANPASPVTITSSAVWVNPLYWSINYSAIPPGTANTTTADTFTITW